MLILRHTISINLLNQHEKTIFIALNSSKISFCLKNTNASKYSCRLQNKLLISFFSFWSKSRFSPKNFFNIHHRKRNDFPITVPNTPSVLIFRTNYVSYSTLKKYHGTTVRYIFTQWTLCTFKEPMHESL